MRAAESSGVGGFARRRKGGGVGCGGACIGCHMFKQSLWGFLVAVAMSGGCAIKMVKVERDMGVVDDDFETLDRDVGPAIKEIIVQDTTITLTAERVVECQDLRYETHLIRNSLKPKGPRMGWMIVGSLGFSAASLGLLAGGTQADPDSLQPLLYAGGVGLALPAAIFDLSLIRTLGRMGNHDDVERKDLVSRGEWARCRPQPFGGAASVALAPASGMAPETRLPALYFDENSRVQVDGLTIPRELWAERTWKAQAWGPPPAAAYAPPPPEPPKSKKGKKAAAPALAPVVAAGPPPTGGPREIAVSGDRTSVVWVLEKQEGARAAAEEAARVEAARVAKILAQRTEKGWARFNAMKKRGTTPKELTAIGEAYGDIPEIGQALIEEGFAQIARIDAEEKAKFTASLRADIARMKREDAAVSAGCDLRSVYDHWALFGLRGFKAQVRNRRSYTVNIEVRVMCEDGDWIVGTEEVCAGCQRDAVLRFSCPYFEDSVHIRCE